MLGVAAQRDPGRSCCCSEQVPDGHGTRGKEVPKPGVPRPLPSSGHQGVHGSGDLRQFPDKASGRRFPGPEGMWLRGQAWRLGPKKQGTRTTSPFPACGQQTPEPVGGRGSPWPGRAPGLVPAPDLTLVVAMLTLWLLSLPEDLLHTRIAQNRTA